MKLWTTIGLERLPEILKNGFDNPYADELLFWNNPEIGAENALAFEGELAFIEAEIPDSQIEDYFEPCMGSWSDSISDAESQIESLQEEGGNEESIAQLQRDIKTMDEMKTAQESLNFFGFACLTQTLPPDMLKLLDPTKMLEAVHSGDADAVVEAVQTAEATGFKSLNAAFWVWLMFLLGEIFGPGYGIQQDDTAEEPKEGDAERQTSARRPRRKKKAKKKASPA